MKQKTFDCLAMKDDLQRQLLERLRNLAPADRRAAIRDDLEKSGSPMGRLWRALADPAAKGDLQVAEPSTEYGKNREI